MKKLLLIEDDPVAGKFYADQFSNAEYYVEWTLNGKTGLSALARLKPDAVILGQYLPDMTGTELISRIRSESGLPMLGIVALLDSADPDLARAARKAGANRTGVKLQDNLIKAVRESIEEARTAATNPPAPEQPETPALEDSQAAPSELHESPAPAIADTFPSAVEPAIEMASSGPEPAPSLQALSRSLLQADDKNARAQFIPALLEKTEEIALNGPPLAAKMAQSLVVLLKDLWQKPDSLSPSTSRTVHQAVALIVKLVELPSDETEPARPWRVLAVDDEVVARMTVAKALASIRLDSETASNPSEALNLLRERSYDLFILDVNMPGMDGFQLCEKLRGSRAHAETPVIFVTARSDFESRLRFARSGGDDFIAKPFVPSELAAKALQHVLSRFLLIMKARAAVSQRSSSAPTPAAKVPVKTPPRRLEVPAPATNLPTPEITPDPGWARAAAKLKVFSRSLIQADRDDKRLPLIAEIKQGVEQLAGSGAALLSKVAAALLVLLNDLQNSPDRIGTSNVRTIQQAIEFLDKLINHRMAELEVKPWRVLGVDDEVVARMTVSKAMALVQIAVETAKGPNEALELLKEHSYDLFILDVNMPDMDGFQLCEKLRTSQTHAKVPVIFATARSDFESRLRFARSGAEDFIAKPFLASELATKALQQLLNSDLGLL